MDNNNAKLTSLLEIPNEVIAISDAVINIQNTINVSENDTTTMVSKPRDMNTVKFEKDVKLDGVIKSYGVKDRHLEPNEQITIISTVYDVMKNKANFSHEIEENISNNLIMDSAKTSILRFDEILYYFNVVFTII